MKYSTNKLEQALYIEKNGCSDLNCNTCQFINGSCRVMKPDTSIAIKKDVIRYIRKEKINAISHIS